MPHEFAPAKLNLALHVRARRADGYHELETLFAFADIGDTVSAEPAEQLSLTITGPFAAELTADDNLVLRAARVLGEAAGHAPAVALTLDKRLPVASGIGGGSADAAATLRLLARHWAIAAADPVLGESAARLGADVPACLASRTLVGTGRGADLAPVPLGPLEGAPILLGNPGIALSTAAVFARWDGRDRGPLPAPARALADGRNDLQSAAIAQAPAIAALLDAMTATGARAARMSGSGATCFAVYGDAATRDAAAAQLCTAWPGAWIAPARLTDDPLGRATRA